MQKLIDTSLIPKFNTTSGMGLEGVRLSLYSHLYALMGIMLPRISKFLPSLPSNLLLHSCMNVRHSWKHLEGVGVLGVEEDAVSALFEFPPKKTKKQKKLKYKFIIKQ